MNTRSRLRERMILTGVLISIALVIFVAAPRLAAQTPPPLPPVKEWNTNGNDIYNTNSGNVGIGTSSPTRKLTLVGDFKIQQPSGASFSLFGGSNSPDAGHLVFGDGSGWKFHLGNNTNNRLFTFTDTGYLGIGTSNPDKLLTVQGSSNRRTLKLISDGDGVGYSGIDLVALTNTNIPDNRAADFFLSMRKDTWYGGDGSGPSFIIETGSKSGNNFSAPFTITPTNDILLNSGRGVYGMPIGNVGIGTATPGFKLDVQGGPINGGAGLCINGDCRNSWSEVGGGVTNAAQVSAGSFGANTGGGTYSFPSVVNVNGGSNGNWASLNVGGTASINAAGNIYSYSRICAGNASGNCDSSNGVVIAGWGSNAYGNVYLTGSGNSYFNGGNVGIGSSAPVASLDIGGAPNLALRTNTLAISGNNTGSNDRPYLRGLSDHFVLAPAANRTASADSNTMYLAYPGDLAPGDTVSTRIQETLFISASGSGGGSNVGIGAASPSYKLDVSGDLRSTGTIYANANGAKYFQGGDDAALYDVNIANTMGVYGVQDSSVATIKLGSGGGTVSGYNGNVGIGLNNPQYKLDVAGNINSSATITGNNIVAKYQDVAEWVPSSERLAAGTVVVLDSTKSNQVIASTEAYDTRVAGVVSAQPGIALGEKSEDKVLVATTGRVRVKVDASRLPIQIGDLLVTSDIPGVAMKSEPVEIAGRKMHMPGTIIGKALEPLKKSRGEILVLLSLQ